MGSVKKEFYAFKKFYELFKDKPGYPTGEELAKRFGVCQHTIVQWYKRVRPKGSTIDDLAEFMKTNNVNEYSLSELAKKFNRDRCTIRKWLKKLGATTGYERLTARAHIRFRSKVPKLLAFLDRIGYCNIAEALHVIGETREFYLWFKEEYPDEKRIVVAYKDVADRIISWSKEYARKHGRRPRKKDIIKKFGNVEIPPDTAATAAELAEHAWMRQNLGGKKGAKFYHENKRGVGVNLYGKIWTRYFDMWLEKSGYEWSHNMAIPRFTNDPMYTLPKSYFNQFYASLTAIVREWKNVVGTTKSRRRFRILTRKLESDPFFQRWHIPLNAYLRTSITGDDKLLAMTEREVVDYLVGVIAERYDIPWRRHD